MGLINLLDKSVAELIAAGEVIDRPASVVKELVENSIDSGANKIKIEINNGGVTYIKITDNGCGINKDDIKKAFLRHATSKIKNVDDLESIMTLGFRGEALASVSAVAKIELITKTQDDVDGSRYFINGEKDGVLEAFGAPVGTTIVVKDLFFNVPARMKFLKKDSTEGNAVTAIVEKLALSHPEISFTLIKDGFEKLATFGDKNLLSTIRCVLGKDFSSKLLPLKYNEDNLFINGYISNPSETKRSRSLQNFFVNSRYVKSKTCAMALEEAYRSFMVKGYFPGCVLNLKIPSSLIDINVHPTKLEIRFANTQKVYNFIYAAVKNCILSNAHNPIMDIENKVHKIESFSDRLDNIIKTSLTPLKGKSEPDTSHLSSTNPNYLYNNFKRTNYIQQDDFNRLVKSAVHTYDELNKSGSNNYETNFFNNSSNLKNKNLSNPYASNSQQDFDQNKIIDENQTRDNTKIKPQTTDQLSDFSTSGFNHKFIGEIFNSYIILEHTEEIIFIDKHAAHERLIYETIKNGNIKNHRQLLLTPLILSLSLKEYDICVENVSIFENIGFLIEDFGNKSIIIREIPNILSNLNITDIVSDIINDIIKNKNNITPHIIDKIYFTVACKAAIKAGDKNDNLELKELVKLLDKNQNLKNCPHGRPIFFEIKKKDIDKQFLR